MQGGVICGNFYQLLLPYSSGSDVKATVFEETAFVWCVCLLNHHAFLGHHADYNDFIFLISDSLSITLSMLLFLLVSLI